MKKFKFAIAFGVLFLASASIWKISEWIEPSFSYSKLESLEIGDELKLNKLSKTLYHIQEQYADPERVNPQEMLKKVFEYLSLSIAEVSIEYPTDKYAVLQVKDAKKQIDLSVKTIYGLKTSIADVLKFVLQNKISDIRIEELETTAINAVLATLDPHSQYLSKETYEETKVGTSGQFGGLGIVIGIRDAVLTVIAPLEDTPAFRAGLKAGDQITKISGEPTESILLEEAVKKMRGPKNTSVTLTVMRKNWTETRDFKITRDIINIVSIESQSLNANYGYVKIKAFQEDTASSLKAHLDKLKEKAGGNLKGLIVDLRNNPGGLLDQAIGVSDVFLKEGVIVSTVGPKNKLLEEDRAHQNGTQPDYPIIILTNIGSASASEIVSGALQQHKRAIVLGERTFGKATVQQLFSLPPDAALKLTVSKYLTAGSKSIQNIGITPEIRAVPAMVKKDMFDLIENTSSFREDKLEGHFSGETQEQPKKSEVEVRYFLDGNQEDENEFVSLSSLDSDEKREAKLLSDFEISFALQILKNTKSASVKDLLKTGRALSSNVEKQESEKIQLALSKLGIDWSPAPSGKKGKCATPEVTWELLTKQKPLRVVTGGSKFMIRTTVTNKSECTFYQLKAVTKSKSFVFSDQEFIFGKLLPRETLNRSVSVELAKSSPDGLLPVDINLSDDGQVKNVVSQMIVPVRATAAPDFAFSYNIKGPVKLGETFDVGIKVKNIGKAKTDRASIALKPEEGVLAKIKRNRMPISELKPGDERQYHFQVSVLPKQTLGELYFDLEISDFAYRTYLKKTLTVPLKTTVKNNSRDFLLPPHVVLTNEKDLLKPQTTKYITIKGEIEDTQNIKDMYILLNQKKVFYTAFETSNAMQQKVPFEYQLPLEAGENQVSIVARDQSDLFGRKSYILFRTEKTE
ncbi:MAG: PDZ domain-containing protein [Bdellovibrionales bacterium]|nr:PDZ domain-containing protein [Bdellovibrionales bacterium]